MRPLVGLLAVAALAAGCASESLRLSASAPFSYASPVESSLERVAIVVTITNLTDNDLVLNPADFWARDADRRIYPANVLAGQADTRQVALVGDHLGMRGLLPLPAATLRKNDVLSGFIVFDVPAGTRPAQLVFRDSDTDHVVDLH